MPGFPPLSPCRFAHWLRFDGWPVQQAAFILNGWEPPGLHDLRTPKIDPYSLSSSPPRWGDLFDSRWDDRTEPLMSPANWERALEVRDLYTVLAMAVACKKIPTFNYYEGMLVRDTVKPRDAIQFAMIKEYNLPPDLITWFNGHTAETCGVVSNSPVRRNITKEDKQAIQQYALEQVAKRGNPPHNELVNELTSRYSYSKRVISQIVKAALKNKNLSHLISGGSGRPKNNR